MAFAMRVVRFVQAMPKTEVMNVIGRQLLRSGTSVGANYRSACSAKSHADFISKMGIVHEECDESLYWMELLLRTGLIKSAALENLMQEGQEIRAMVVASLRTARSRK